MGSGGGSRTERHPGPAVQIAGVAGPRRRQAGPGPHPPGKGRRMTEYEAASLTASYIGLAIAAGNMLAAIVAAAGIRVFGSAMHRSNKQRAEAEKNRHEESMTALKELIRRTSPSQPGPAECPAALPLGQPPSRPPPFQGGGEKMAQPASLFGHRERSRTAPQVRSPLFRSVPGACPPWQGGGWEGGPHGHARLHSPKLKAGSPPVGRGRRRRYRFAAPVSVLF